MSTPFTACQLYGDGNGLKQWISGQVAMITGTSLTHHTTHSHFHDEIDEGPATPGDDDDDDDDKDKVSLFSKEHFPFSKMQIEILVEYLLPCKIYKIDKTDVWPSITRFISDEYYMLTYTCHERTVVFWSPFFDSSN